MRQLGRACYVVAIALAAIGVFRVAAADGPTQVRAVSPPVAPVPTTQFPGATADEAALIPPPEGTRAESAGARGPVTTAARPGQRAGGAAQAARPRLPGNTAPVISAPDSVTVARHSDTPVPGISVDDVESRRFGDRIGVLLYAPRGYLTFRHTDGVEFRQPNGSAWLPIIGTVDALNRVLGSLTYTARVPTGRHELDILSADFGHDGRYVEKWSRIKVPVHLH